MARLYLLCGYSAGVFILTIAVAILIQIFGRIVDANLFGLVEIATYAMIGATFIALPYTMWTGGHIRVHLLLGILPERPRWFAELISALIALVFAAIFFYYCLELTIESFRRGALSQGMLASPLWIPQSFVTCGIGIFGAALVDHLVRLIKSGSVPHDENQGPI